MSYVITRLCVGCVDTACVDACPTDAIVERHPGSAGELSESATEQLYINPDNCIFCGACEPACPAEAIFDEDDVPAHMTEDIEINAEAARRPDDFRVARSRSRK